METIQKVSLKAKVQNFIQEILDHAFKGDSEKRRFHVSHDRLNFACPYCGDSSSDSHKKRGNVYWISSNYHCFNCLKHTSVDQLLLDFGARLESEDKIELHKNYQQHKKIQNNSSHLDFGIFKKLSELAINKDDFFIKMNIFKINERTDRAYAYLKSRMLHNKLEYFAYNPKTRRLFILNLDNTSTKVISYQIRNLDNYGNRYSTYKMSKMREFLGLKMTEDEELNANLDAASMIFNLLRVDFSIPVTIFEGPLDSVFMKNSIALAGAHKNTLEFDQISTVRYFLDDDLTGKKISMEKIKIDKSVFLWSKYKKIYNLQRTKIKDLNQLILYAYKNKRADILNGIAANFSSDRTDLIHV